MHEKKIDILMAVYNGEKFIGRQIESIMGQTYKNTHLWIRDNCSHDGTVAIVKGLLRAYPGRMTLLLSPTNVGILGNFGALLEKSLAEYVMLADSDDVWLEKKVEYTMQKMKELEEKHGSGFPLLVHTDLHVVNEKLETIHPSFWKYSKLDPHLPHTLSRQLLQNQITGCTTMVNRPLLSLALPVPQDIVMHDWWLGICTAAFGKKAVVEEATMLYRQHGKNDTGAMKCGLISYLKSRFNRPVYQKKMALNKLASHQAEAFLGRYESKLSPEQKETVKKFIDFQDAFLIKKAYLMIKYGFYRVGLVRNILMILGSSQISKLCRWFR